MVANIVFARSASYVRTLVQNSSVRVCVRVCVKKIIDFCREYMNPRHVLLSTETLKTCFGRFQKKTSKSQVKLYHRPVRDQFWDQVLANFLCQVNKNMTDPRLSCQRPVDGHKMSV